MRKFPILAIMLTMLACVSPAIITPTPTSVHKEIHINTEVPQKAALTPKSVLVTAYETVNVREDPTEHSPAVGYLHNGDSVSVYECEQATDGGWWARVDGGWVNSKFLAEACE